MNLCQTQTDDSMASLIDRLRHPRVSNGERRDGNRHLCSMAARLYLDDAHEAVGVVEDFSLGGCRVRLDRSLVKVGTTLYLDLPARGTCHHGVVVWARGMEVGIRFSARRTRVSLGGDTHSPEAACATGPI